MGQWRDDVDRLLGIAHIGSVRPKSQLSASVRSPSVRAAPTKDLWAELNRRRVAEDMQVPQERPEDLRDELNRRRADKNARLSLGKARECRRSLGGHNLEQDFAMVAPQGPGDARFQTSIPLAGVGYVALTDQLRAAAWPTKFCPHLLEKYDGTTNTSKFLQVYVTTITAAGGDTTVMATYFHVALTRPARTWLMNQAPGSIYSWEELCVRFMANFTSAYQQHGVEAHLHAVKQEPRETLRAFISCFTKVRGTIPRISDASIITAFRQGVRDEKMLEKLATRDVDNINTLFALADKCARAAEGRAWHSAPQAGVTQTGGSDADAQGDGKKKKRNKGRGREKQHVAAPVIAVVAGGQGKRSWPQEGNDSTCPVHPDSRHSVADYREIIKLARRVSKRREQSSKDGSSPRRWLHKEEADERAAAVGDRTSATSRPRETLRTFSPKKPTPATTTTAARSCMSCTAEAGSSSHAGVSRPCDGRSCRQYQESPTMEEHHHLFRGTRLPRQHGGGRRTTAHHRPHCRQYVTASRVDRWRGWPQRN
jgi:hypothetical protein